jgi:hypothetical protein
MQYYGKLYGKLGGKYFDTEKTGNDFDTLELQNAIRFETIKRCQSILKKMAEAIKHADNIKDLWKPNGVYLADNEGEARALHKMDTEFTQLLKEYDLLK